jgi:lipopolysaccharide export LptBFGC system permease protein LptF
MALATRMLARDMEAEGKRSELLAEYAERSRSGAGLDSSFTQLSTLRNAYVMLESKPVRDRSLDIYRLEYHKKFSIPAGALCFVFLAFPLGARARKSGRAVGFGIGLIVAVGYWALLIGGQTMGLRAGFDPLLAMWAPNVLVLAASIPFLVMRSSS